MNINSMSLTASYKSTSISFVNKVYFLICRDLSFILTLDIDWVALSFVQRPQDIVELRDLLHGHKLRIMAKLEKPSAIHLLEEVMKLYIT